jgi:5-methylcytosine-specific restriction endonuclease McrA
MCATRRERTNPYTTPTWRRLSLAVVQRDGGCVECGSTSGLNAHHVVPRVEGGPDTLENCVALCVVCHGRESAAERR